MLQCCLESAASDGTGNGDPVNRIGIERLLVTAKEKLVALTVLNGSRTVLRIPLSDAALKACQNNLETLRALKHAAGANVAPLPVTDGRLAGYYYAVESRMSGRPMRSLPRASSDLVLIEALIKQLNLNAAVREFDDELYDQLVSTPLRKLAEVTGSLRWEQAVEPFFRSRLRGKQMTLGISHGDLSLSNVFVNGGEIAGVIDWDDSSLSGIPLLDAISHLCSRQFRRSRNFSQTFISLAARRWPEPEELSFLDRCYEHFRTDPNSHDALVFLYWLRLVHRQLDFGFARESAVVRSRLDEVSRAIVRH
jgi:aminoglycoside phosphotransferase (APT) family kinase protein